ncbi:MAG: MtnX-like HAD-IB family phosphatase [Endomicrobia bacterium]|nr:MtnX-like HAD-IB family phosphatase [Endomicrobiia bacterium]MCL2507290.1 MtnX-like HAD-IB family phosphatase [Endomicrobiia bacterium]
MIEKKIAFISDFDGTITKEDFFNMVIERLLTPDDLKPWQDYLDKKITHYQALGEIFSKIRISQSKLEQFIQSIEIDPYFTQTLDVCKTLKIPIYICSAGMDYYILKRIPREIEKYNITLLSNKGEYSPEIGFTLTPPPSDHMFFNKNTGISKEALVEHLKNQGFFTIYAGDGIPDLKAAKIADTVFAKSVLLELCRKQNIKTLEFNDFRDITKYIKQLKMGC